MPLALALSGCATVRTQNQGRLPPGDAGTADAGAEADFQAAVGRFTRRDPAARSTLEGFVARHPGHPFRVTAVALLGRLALGRGDAAGAKSLVESQPGGASTPALSFVLGVAESRLGHADRALALLRPFSQGGGLPSMGGATDEEAEMLLRTALAEALAVGGNPAGALGEWDRYAQLGTTQDHERAYARARIEELAARLSNDAALQAYRSTSSPLLRAALATRAAGSLRAHGQADAARKLDEEAASGRRSQGLERAAPWLGPGDPGRLGLAVPLSGNRRLLGEVALRGAMIALGENSHSPEAPGYQLVVRDTALGNDRGTQSAGELIRQEAVIGIVGAGGLNERGALEMATRDGVPYLALDEQVPGRQSTTFQLVHGSDARAAELARRALAAGARSFAVLGPDSPAARKMADAFKRAVVAGKGQVVADKAYAAGTTSFSAPINELRSIQFDAIFIPEESRRLELVAPALAAADLRPAPWAGAGRRATGKGREVLLLSTATALSAGLIKNAGRHVQGALLSPGFFSGAEDPRTSIFVARFRQLHGQDPLAVDAYAFDGVRLLRAAVEQGARTRTDVLRTLASQVQGDGVTGTARFGADHARVDPPLVYTVVGDEVRALP